MVWPDFDLADRHSIFVDIAEHIDEVVRDKSFDIKTPFNLLIPRGVFQNGIGTSREAFVHVPGISPAKGMSGWKAVQKAGTGTPPYDPCNREPELVTHGYKKIEYQLYQYSQATEAICVSDITTLFEFERQATLMTNWLATVTIQTWDAAFRDYYLQLASNANEFYILHGGIPVDSITYNMTALDADGDKVITIPRAAFESLSLMDWKSLNYIRRRKQLVAAGAAVANETGEPLFGLICDADDLDEAISRNEDWRERYLYAEPSILVQGYGKLRRIPGYVVMEDPMIPRFVVKSITSTDVTLKMVTPLKQETHSGMEKGTDVTVNDEYMTAPVGLAYVFVRNSFRADVRAEDPKRLGNGMVFGPMPGYTGVFKWINNPDMSVNIRGDKGMFLADYAYAGYPLDYYDQPAAFIYRRCVASLPVTCDVDPNAVSGQTTVLIASNTAYKHVAGSTTMADITLVSKIKANVGADLTLVKNDSTEVDCLLVDDVNAPTYRIVFAAGQRPAEADVNNPAVAGIKVDA